MRDAASEGVRSGLLPVLDENGLSTPFDCKHLALEDDEKQGRGRGGEGVILLQLQRQTRGQNIRGKQCLNSEACLRNVADVDLHGRKCENL